MSAYTDNGDVLWAYLIDTRTLLHDASGDYFTDPQLVNFINQARVHTAVDTGCLRTRETVTFPAGIEQFAIGGVYQLTNVAVPAGGTAPYSLVSGGGATAAAKLGNTPGASLSVGVVSGGTYYQPPLVTFDGGSVPLSAVATTVLGSPLPAAVTQVVVNQDAGLYAAGSVTPSVVFTPAGVAGAAVDDGTGHLMVSAQGSGQVGGVVIQDAAGVITSVPAGSASILNARIASIDQITCNVGYRIALRNMAYSDFNIAYRGQPNYQAWPNAFAIYGDTLFLGPVPANAYTYELDCLLYPLPLSSVGQMGEIADRMSRQPVPYYAAYLARLSQGEADQASQFLQLYQRMVAAAVNRFTTRLSQLWPDNENLY
ncbi:MAG: hypothetical protein EPN38_09270 [Rhodanobacteraceae bacterium]|nr:MAG: hypothetical protein EPN38_09270 [Rhodanobacteraceae bacterium]